MSYWVGGSLINRNSERYAREADLRFSLVRVNEHLDGISLAGGEPDERRRVELHMGNVLAATRRLVSGLTNLTWVTAGFGWITIVAPILVAAPMYFAGKISFGGLMMAAAAFTQAQSSLRWFVDNFSIIADWRATLHRVASFRYALTTTEELQRVRQPHQLRRRRGRARSQSTISRSSPRPAGTCSRKECGREGGRARAHRRRARHRQDAVVSRLGGPVAVGRRDITRPKDEAMLYLPRGTPYLPRGTLKEVLAYPLKVDDFAEDAFAHALGRSASSGWCRCSMRPGAGTGS